MKDVAFQYHKIINSVARYQNGDISLLMNKSGLQYKINFGVSVPDIDILAKEHEPDNELAVYLLKQDERESKLIGMRLFDTKNDLSAYLDFVISCITNIELAEQAAMHFFVKLTDFAQIAQKLIVHNNEFCRLSAYLAISKFARGAQNIENEVFENYLKILESTKPFNNAVYNKRAMSAMLLGIGLRNQILGQKIIRWIDAGKLDNKEYKEWFKQEVNYYLLIKN